MCSTDHKQNEQTFTNNVACCVAIYNTMAKPTKAKQLPEKQIIINNIDIRQIDRTSQDIESWRTAIRSAESVFNPTRKRLYDLYHDILLDGMLSSAIEKRQNAIINRPFSFMHDGVEYPEVMEMTQTEEWDEMVREMLNARFWGYTLLELKFAEDKLISNLIDRRHVKPELEIVSRTPYDMTGIRYLEPPYSRYTLAVGKPKALGILMKVAQYVIYKRGDYGDWADFAEIFGMPFRKGTYEPYDENSRLELTNALKEAGSAAYAVIPRGTEIEFIANNSANANGDLYDKLRKACNEEINVCILGQTLTTTQGEKGARSLGEVHQDVLSEIHEADKQYVINTINSKLLPLLRMHYPWMPAKGKFIIPETENIGKKERLDMDIKIAKQVPVADDHFYETYDIPKPDNYDQLKDEQRQRQMMASQQPKAGTQSAPPPAGGAGGGAPGKAKQAVNNLLDFFR